MKIELQQVCLRYGDESPLATDMSAVFDAGDFVLIEGPSGSGKTSLLRLLNRLQEPASGQIRIDGKPLAEHEVTQLRRRVAYLQQSPVMLAGTVTDNLQLPFRYAASRGSTPPDAERIAALLDHYVLDVRADADATRLSQGQKQRLALIRILLQEPQVLLCDEPTSALDPESRRIVQHELERQSVDHRRTVIVVTHLEFTPRETTARRFRLSRSEGLREVTA